MREFEASISADVKQVEERELVEQASSAVAFEPRLRHPSHARAPAGGGG
jgi:hypothetical protein